jgi:hypothetical protein
MPLWRSQPAIKAAVRLAAVRRVHRRRGVMGVGVRAGVEEKTCERLWFIIKMIKNNPREVMEGG